MTFTLTAPSVRRRLLAAVILALLAGGMLAADRLLGEDAPRGPDVVAARTGSGDIEKVIDGLLVRHHLDPGSARTWAVRTAGKRVIRTESRINVSAAFLSVEFNHELNRALLPLGARVIATEHSKEQAVAMHVRKDGVVVRTLVFRTASGTAGPAPPRVARTKPAQSRSVTSRHKERF